MKNIIGIFNPFELIQKAGSKRKKSNKRTRKNKSRKNRKNITKSIK